MRRGALTMLLSLAVLSALPASAAMPEGPRTSSLSAVISTVRSKKGHVGCALFATPEGFPDSHTAPIRQRWLTINGKTVECTFDKLPPGSYAFAIYHDENDNGDFDNNFLGFPKEGWGTSNNIKHFLKEPTFEESRIDLAAGASVQVKVILHYP